MTVAISITLLKEIEFQVKGSLFHISCMITKWCIEFEFLQVSRLG